MTELLDKEDFSNLRANFRGALTKISQSPKYKSVDSLNADVAKDCRTCKSDDAYKPVPQGNSKLASMVEELLALGAITNNQAIALDKTAENIPATEARYSLRRLKRLEEGRPTLDQLGRGAAVGAVVGPLAALAGRAIAGKAVRAPTDQQLLPKTRQLLAQAGSGAVFGGGMPALTNKIEREAEIKTLKNYLSQQELKNAPLDTQQSGTHIS